MRTKKVIGACTTSFDVPDAWSLFLQRGEVRRLRRRSHKFHRVVRKFPRHAHQLRSQEATKEGHMDVFMELVLRCRARSNTPVGPDVRF